ncbi:putative AIG2-like family protein [Lyophyllum shimeji]|uniref:gamma-glutamylcyclotransferase n=1 Tax=Lyophyllum shimeji TaxID=47721 RepID=A0A9P3UKT9_LYOSH|nr:putative AIG2-like family protein [Lyophyllum shimeji]
MKRRCPGSTYIGTALLSKWKWIINSAGYANVIPSQDDIVYGMIYTLTADDEIKLDGFEGVPHDYHKRVLPVKFFGREDPSATDEGKIIQALVYTDVERLNEGPPRTEYIYRINQAVKDAIQEGIPKEYFEKYFRRFIPAEEIKN